MHGLLRKLFKKQIARDREAVEVVPSCDLPSKGLERLRDLTERLPATPFAAITSGGVSPDFYLMRDVKGTREIVAFPLYFDGMVRIERAIMEAGATIETHYHAGEIQHVILVRGRMRIFIRQKDGTYFEKEIKSGEACYFGPNIEHYVEAKENCYYINLNIPMANSEGVQF